MTDDLVKRLRLAVNELYGTHPCGLMNDAAARIGQLEAALRECEVIVKRRQDENVRRTEWEGSKLAQAKARATATRCGMILGELRKHISAALAGEKKDD
jgi:hypothetical protein